jgi:hypothetical protein
VIRTRLRPNPSSCVLPLCLQEIREIRHLQRKTIDVRCWQILL